MSIILVFLLVVTVLSVELVLNARRRRAGQPLVESPLAPMRQPFVPPGVFVDEGHAWAAFAADGSFKVGVDDLVAEALGEIQAVDLPPLGAKVKRGEPLFCLRLAGAGRAGVAIAAPIDGEVVAVNDDLALAPRRVLRDPYGRGWMLRLRSADDKAALDPLYVGNNAIAFLRREYRRLVDFISHVVSPAGEVALADGGAIQRGAVGRLPEAALTAFSEQFLNVKDASPPPA